MEDCTAFVYLDLGELEVTFLLGSGPDSGSPRRGINPYIHIRGRYVIRMLLCAGFCLGQLVAHLQFEMGGLTKTLMPG